MMLGRSENCQQSQQPVWLLLYKWQSHKPQYLIDITMSSQNAVDDNNVRPLALHMPSHTMTLA